MDQVEVGRGAPKRATAIRTQAAKALIVISGVALAGASFVNAYANVTRVIDPNLTLRLVPTDSLAIAYAANRAFMAAPTDAAVRAASTRKALRSLRGSLLNPVAVRLVAPLFEARPPRLLAVLNAAQNLTRRDVTTQLILIETNVLQQNISGALLSYDHILQQRPEMGETLFPVLAGASRDPAIAPALAKLFSAGVPWSGPFIDWAVTNDPHLGTLLPVIDAARPNAIGLSQGRKQAIIKRLVELADYEAAVLAYRRYATGISRAQDFARASVYAPLDWEVQNGPGLDGAIDPAANLFQFTLQGPPPGTILRRLVAVTPGSYRIMLDGKIAEAAAARVVSRATCAQSGMVLGTAMLQPGASAPAIFTVPADCAFVWLSLEGAAPSDDAVEGNLSRFRLVPAGAGSTTAPVHHANHQDI